MVSEEELIRRCKLGQADAFASLYHAHVKAVYNTSLRLLKTKPDAEDITQETFVAAFQQINQFKPLASIRSWLKQIAVFKSIDLLRKSKNKWRPLDDIELVEPDILISESYEGEIDIEQIRHAIEKLAESYRIVFVLHTIEGYTHSEIAELFGETPEAIRVRFYRARKHLMALLIKLPLK